MKDTSRRSELENHPRLSRQSYKVMNVPTVRDDRAAVMGDFLRTCDSMISGFEALYDGIEMSTAEAEPRIDHSAGGVSASRFWMRDDFFAAG